MKLVRLAELKEAVKKHKVKRRACIFKPTWVWTDKEEQLIKSRIIGLSLNVCSGFNLIADVNLDLYVESDVQADMHYLPFRDFAFDTVICDPPWFNPKKWNECQRFIKELERVARRRIIMRTGKWFFNHEPHFKLTEAWLIKGISPIVNLITVWDRAQTETLPIL